MWANLLSITCWKSNITKIFIFTVDNQQVVPICWKISGLIRAPHTHYLSTHFVVGFTYKTEKFLEYGLTYLILCQRQNEHCFKIVLNKTIKYCQALIQLHLLLHFHDIFWYVFLNSFSYWLHIHTCYMCFLLWLIRYKAWNKNTVWPIYLSYS